MLKKIAFGFIFLTLNVAIIEIGLRLFDYVHPTSIFYREDYNQYRGKPHSDNFGYRLNSQGFKDKEYAENKAEGVYRIVGVGDSFTFGVSPYPYNFLTILEDSLNALPTLPPVEIINMGISSTGPPHYLSLIADEALKLKPDMILLSFFVGNDIMESSRDSRKRKMYTYSYLASALHYVYKIVTGLNQNSIAATYGDGYTYCDTCSFFKPDKYIEAEAQRSYVFQKGNAKYGRNVRDALVYLEQIKNLCERAGTELVVVLIPDEMQISRTLQQKVMKFEKITSKQWDNSQPDNLLTKEIQGKVIDLLPAFITFSEDTSLYIPNDTHWNIRGNRLAADKLAEALPGFIVK